MDVDVNQTDSPPFLGFTTPNRRKRARLSPNLGPSKISLSNKFASLENADSEEQLIKKRNRPPPIIIPQQNSLDIKKVLECCKSKDLFIRNTSIGVKIQLTNKEDYAIVSKYLDDNKAGYFTHSARYEQINKFVLFGLHEV